MSLLLGLMSRPSQDGSWCAVIGIPELGAEAAESLGVDLGRLVLVPDPGPRWLAVTSTIAEVVPVVAVRPPTRAADGQVARLAARLRDRGTVLLVQGPWPQAEAMLEVGDPEWTGVGRGHGYLDSRAVTVTSSSRRWPHDRRERMLLPGPRGEVALVPEARGTRGAEVPMVAPVPAAQAPVAVPMAEAAPVRAVPALAEERELPVRDLKAVRELEEEREIEAVRVFEAERRRQERFREARRILEAVG